MVHTIYSHLIFLEFYTQYCSNTTSQCTYFACTAICSLVLGIHDYTCEGSIATPVKAATSRMTTHVMLVACSTHVKNFPVALAFFTYAAFYTVDHNQRNLCTPALATTEQTAQWMGAAIMKYSATVTLDCGGHGSV